MHQWNVSQNKKQASEAAADYIFAKAVSLLKEKDRCNIALPGGESPAHCLKYLAGKKLNWDKIHWYLGDERCYPPGHENRNDVMIEKNLWSLINAPSENKHVIKSELGAEAAADIYSREIINSGGIDIILLGMGEDGHTASLFPGNEALLESKPVVPVHDSPKEPLDRVSLSKKTISEIQNKCVLVFGKEKARTISATKKGENFPINNLGDLSWFIDIQSLEKQD